MKFNSLILLLGIPLIADCTAPSTKYLINDSYIGPVVVFITALDVNKHEDSVLIKDGLGVIDNSDMNNVFNIISIESRKELNIVPIGNEKMIDNESRNIFGLVQGISRTNCFDEKIKMIRFFVGTKIDFERWSAMYDDELSYFDSIRLDWCGYYQSQSHH